MRDIAKVSLLKTTPWTGRRSDTMCYEVRFEQITHVWYEGTLSISALPVIRYGRSWPFGLWFPRYIRTIHSTLIHGCDIRLHLIDTIRGAGAEKNLVLSGQLIRTLFEDQIPHLQALVAEARTHFRTQVV